MLGMDSALGCIHWSTEIEKKKGFALCPGTCLGCSSAESGNLPALDFWGSGLALLLFWYSLQIESFTKN
jgi:hypothetical protein